MKLIYVADLTEHTVSITDRLHYGDVEIKVTGKGGSKAEAVKDAISRTKELQKEFSGYLERLGAL